MCFSAAGVLRAAAGRNVAVGRGAHGRRGIYDGRGGFIVLSKWANGAVFWFVLRGRRFNAERLQRMR